MHHNQEGHKKALLLRYNQLICCTKFSLISMQCLDLKWISCHSKEMSQTINLSPAQITLWFPLIHERNVTFYRTQQTKFKKKCYLWIVYVRATIHNFNSTILQTSIFNIYKCIYITTEKAAPVDSVLTITGIYEFVMY